MFKLILSFLCIFSLIGSSLALAQDPNERLKKVRITGQVYDVTPEMVEEIMDDQSNLTQEQEQARRQKIDNIIRGSRGQNLTVEQIIQIYYRQ